MNQASTSVGDPRSWSPSWTTPPGDGSVVGRSLDGQSTPLPLVLEPRTGSPLDVDGLAAWLTAHHDWIGQTLTTLGAVLLRGFPLTTPPRFERVARAVSPDLKNDYLGTSPRGALTPYVFSASELPPYYPIAQHCEMSFTKSPPSRIFFCCLVPPRGGGGETPIVDFRKVARDLRPDVRRRFTERGVRNIRNYAGPEGGSRWDPWKLKRWDEMFQTRDKELAEERCRENEFEVTWLPGGRLRLINTQPAIRPHPVTGEPVWYNHSQVFHLSSVPGEYQRIARRQGRLEIRLLAEVARAMVFWKRRLTATEDQSMHCTYGDGTPIPDADMDAVREAIWQNMVFFPWREGDALLIDNASVAHGRMPYRGSRQVVVAWS